MSPPNQLVGLLVAAVLSACGPVSPYKSTAAELVQTEYFVSTSFEIPLRGAS